jgi:hypothetical protein
LCPEVNVRWVVDSVLDCANGSGINYGLRAQYNGSYSWSEISLLRAVGGSGGRLCWLPEEIYGLGGVSNNNEGPNFRDNEGCWHGERLGFDQMIGNFGYLLRHEGIIEHCNFSASKANKSP